jgi:tRNA-2-methylthio-N6-dimethylallyladenosine synthase
MADMLTNQGQGVALEARADVEKLEMPAVRPAGPRAWVNIMYGCNNFCTYCIVPYTRGRETSRRSANIINEIRELSRSGYREITLLGQNVNSYSDEVDFPGLLGMIHDLDGIERIRFTTNHPRDLGPELIEAMATLPKVCHHIHLPLQSGSDRILKAMNRKYTLEEYSAKVEALRAAIPDIAITTDIITGFPGELDEDHEATMGALRRLRYDGLFGFRYSPREGTRAAEMLDQVPEALKQARLQEVLDLQEEFTSAINESLVGRELEVLVDGASENDKHRLSGRTPGNKIVSFEGELSLTGSLVNVRIERAGRHSLYGVIIG